MYLETLIKRSDTRRSVVRILRHTGLVKTTAQKEQRGCRLHWRGMWIVWLRKSRGGADLTGQGCGLYC